MCSVRVTFHDIEDLNINVTSLECFNIHIKTSIFSAIDCCFKDSRSMVTNPSVPGLARKYLLQKSVDVNRVNHTEPIIEPIARPVVLHMDAYPTLFLCKYIRSRLKNEGLLYIRNRKLKLLFQHCKRPTVNNYILCGHQEGSDEKHTH